MNRLFKLKNGKIKVYFNEDPIEKDYIDYEVNDILQKNTYTIEDMFSIGVEYALHTGPRILYGFMLAYVEPNDVNNTINVSVSYTKENVIHYENSLLVYNSDNVYKGLPEEYLEDVQQAINNKIMCLESFPRCNLRFYSSANCEVGSCSNFYAIIIGVIIELICKSSPEEIANISNERFLEKFDINLNGRGSA